MAASLLALFGAGLIGKGLLERRTRTEQFDALKAQRSESFALGLEQFIRPPGATEDIVTGFPGFSPELGATIQGVFDVDPRAGRELLKFHLDLAEGANVEDRAAETARIQLELQQIRKDELARSISQFATTNDPDEIIKRSQAQKGLREVFDPMTGVQAFVAAPGTDQFVEVTDKALAVADATNSFNALKMSIANNGVITDPADPRFGDQQSTAALFKLGVKRAEDLGALDQGLIDFTDLLTDTDPFSAIRFFWGSDAATLGRLNATSKMFDDKLRTEAENIRLLRPGMVPSERLRFDQATDLNQKVREFTSETIQRLQTQAANFGETADVRNLPTFAQGDTGALPASAFRSPLDDLRTTGIIAGSEIGTMIAALFGFVAKGATGAVRAAPK